MEEEAQQHQQQQQDDTESVISSIGSELLPERTQVPLTQEQLDAVRGFVSNSKNIAELRKQIRESNTAIRKHREVLVSLLKDRKRSRLIIDPETKIELQQAVVKKRPTSKQFHNLVYYTLQTESADVFTRVKAKLERNLKDTEVSVQKESLTLKTGNETKRKQKKKADD